MKHLKAAVKDPLFQQQLTPSYRVGCKRILTSDDYYTALAQPNVRLVASGLKQVRSLVMRHRNANRCRDELMCKRLSFGTVGTTSTARNSSCGLGRSVLLHKAFMATAWSQGPDLLAQHQPGALPSRCVAPGRMV